MALSDVRTYFKTRMSTLNYTQWLDAFNFENIPSYILNSVYHLDTRLTNQVRHSQYDLELTMQAEIRTFLHGYADPESAYDDSYDKIELILKECLKIKNAKVQKNIKNVNLSSIDISPIDATNDNILLVTITFDVFIILDVNK